MILAADIVFVINGLSVDGYEYTQAAHASTGEAAVAEVGQVPQVETKEAPRAKYEGLEAAIAEVFVEDPETAIKIARCESTMNPEAIGDQHLTIEHEGETLGRSIGLLMVRTGGKERNGRIWNRAAEYKMTATEFETFQRETYNRKIRELHSDLCDLVESGDMTAAEANEWLVAKQEQWRGEGIN